MAAVAMTSAVAVGCSSGDTGDTADPAPSVSAPVEPVVEESAEPVEEEPSSAAPSPGPTLSMGGSAEFQSDDEGAGTTTLKVTVASAKYVTPADINTETQPSGEYVLLNLTVKNTGTKPAAFYSTGVSWESDAEAARVATTYGGAFNDASRLSTTYKPGQSATGTLVLDVGAKGGSLTFFRDSARVEPAVTVKLPK
ncbi:DUF4352 domain-containing protein [Streptomyces uncialis]|uniref:DUF4352 domain-containing protein n=1 Tax=Streptomyces uncialis TaxID=1048205 RepID=UPI003810D5B3